MLTYQLLTGRFPFWGSVQNLTLNLNVRQLLDAGVWAGGGPVERGHADPPAADGALPVLGQRAEPHPNPEPKTASGRRSMGRRRTCGAWAC